MDEVVCPRKCLIIHSPMTRDPKNNTNANIYSLHSSLKSDSDGSRAAPLPPAVWDWADITVSDGQWGEGKCLLVTATS